ncbi:19230_t:CDS:2 [Gigaspora margarita]|uniref:19230_t:CDS:1 n=1 Tax=Gigaspora margarita TaxID=4874 RepID=A0ABN7V957_GIGMA|nr:19230_t:CDS:2 [Gigaspora margarita]
MSKSTTEENLTTNSLPAMSNKSQQQVRTDNIFIQETSENHLEK